MGIQSELNQKLFERRRGDGPRQLQHLWQKTEPPTELANGGEVTRARTAFTLLLQRKNTEYLHFFFLHLPPPQSSWHFHHPVETDFEMATTTKKQRMHIFLLLLRFLFFAKMVSMVRRRRRYNSHAAIHTLHTQQCESVLPPSFSRPLQLQFIPLHRRMKGFLSHLFKIVLNTWPFRTFEMPMIYLTLTRMHIHFCEHCILSALLVVAASTECRSTWWARLEKKHNLTFFFKSCSLV